MDREAPERSISLIWVRYYNFSKTSTHLLLSANYEEVNRKLLMIIALIVTGFKIIEWQQTETNLVLCFFESNT